MGEYAFTEAGERVKIGTCEDMLYLRAEQAQDVIAAWSSVDPIRDAHMLRFRFPFPDEDATAPGEYRDPFRSVPVWGATAPNDIEHHRVQFVAHVGYNTTLPCPESGEVIEGVKVHHNGRRGSVRIVQQRVWNGHLATVVTCGGCDTRWRLKELIDAEPIIIALRSTADRVTTRDPQDGRARWWHTIADRIAAGYTDPLPWERVKPATV